jgi:hypothetical protein
MSHPQQIKAGCEIVYKFETTHISYILLMAEMQSGKTGTFLFVIFEMIRTGKTDYGVIFTGNREVELKEQTEKSINDFYDTYATYLLDQGITDLTILDTIKNESRIKVVWGPDLKKFNPLGKTIYVWEESHYGQSKNQEVDKFITRLGIDPTGNSAPEGCFVLSVSATPFSEFTDYKGLNHSHKHIVRMYSPDSYRGIKQMRLDKQIRIYSDSPESRFKKCLKINQNGYAIVRGMSAKLAPIARRYGWDVKEYNQKTNWKINDVLRVEPDRPTVIFIKGKLRMGKELYKKFILWCMETSNNPKTDTLLQGLLGRCCGYDSRSDILIFIKIIVRVEKFVVFVESPEGLIPKKRVNKKGKQKTCVAIVKTNTVFEEIDRFISWHDNTNPEIEFAPRRGTNMCEGSNYLEQIPLKVKFTQEEWDTLYDTHNGNDGESDLKHINHRELRRMLKKKDMKGEIINQNAGTEVCIRTILDVYANPFKMRYPHTKLMNPEEGVKPIDKLIDAFKRGKPIKGLGSGIGVSLNELAVFPHNKERCVYITFCLPNVVGCTTRREVFSKKPLQGFVRPPVAPFQLLDVHLELPTFVEDNFKRTYTTPTYCPDLCMENDVQEQALFSKHPYGLNISPWELSLDTLTCSGNPEENLCVDTTDSDDDIPIISLKRKPKKSTNSSDWLTKMLNKQVTEM